MRLEWAGPALQDIRNLKEYISKDSEVYAQRFVEKIFDAVEKLRHAPRIGRRVPEAEDESIRELLFRSYRLIYRLEPERVVMLAVIHGARDLANIDVKPWDVT